MINSMYILSPNYSNPYYLGLLDQCKQKCLITLILMICKLFMLCNGRNFFSLAEKMEQWF
jgi:hypothetical protein